MKEILWILACVCLIWLPEQAFGQGDFRADLDTVEMRLITDRSEIARIRREYAEESRVDPMWAVMEGDKQALQRLDSYLQSKDKELNFKALYAMSSAFQKCRNDRSLLVSALNGKTSSLLMGLTREQDQRKMLAAFLLAEIDGPGAGERLLEMVEKENPEYYHGISLKSWIGSTTATPKTVAYFEQVLASPADPNHLFWSPPADPVYVLTLLLAKSPPKLRHDINEILTKHFQSQPLVDTASYEYYLSSLAETATADDLSYLKPFWDHFGWASSLLQPFGLVRADPVGARAAIRRQLKADPSAVKEFDLIVEAWRDHPEEGFQALLEGYPALEGKVHAEERMLDACWKLGGQAMVDRFIAFVPGPASKAHLATCLQYKYLPMTDYHPLRVYAKALESLGNPRFEMSDAVQDSLRRTGILVTYERYTRTLVLQWLLSKLRRFDELLMGETRFCETCNKVQSQFALRAQGKLDGLECFHHAAMVGNEAEAKTWIIFRGRCYEMQGQLATELHVPGVESRLLQAMNRIVADAGFEERFVNLAPHNSGTIAFLLPEQARQLGRFLEVVDY